MFNKIFLLLILVCAWTVPAWADELGSLAEGIYQKYAPAIYQVQSISIQTNKRNSVGSGFQISKDGYVATNYHVISNSVIYPDLFQLRIVQADGKEVPAKVVRFDVIHDLAIIKIVPSQEMFLPLGSSDINKGKPIFSIGNPMDFGMTILSGLSNGYMERTIYKKVLTTLSLNHGMSGGPSVDEEGKVIGINVATAGDALSFLVPVEFLKELWQQIQVNGYKPVTQFTDELQQQLIAQEDVYFKNLIDQKWERQKFGDFTVPSVLLPEFTCWGKSEKDLESWIDRPYLSCFLKDDVYISSSLRAHSVLFNYSWIKSLSYNPWRFYSITDHYVSKGYRFDLDDVYYEDAKNFKCRSDLVKIGNHPFWVSTCVRQLRKLNKLYDVNVRMASLGETQKMLVIELTLGSLTKDTAKKFLNKFYKEIQ